MEVVGWTVVVMLIFLVVVGIPYWIGYKSRKAEPDADDSE